MQRVNCDWPAKNMFILRSSLSLYWKKLSSKPRKVSLNHFVISHCVNKYNTVKHVFKGHCDEGTPCDQGTLSQNRVLSSPMLKNLWLRDTCHVGTLSLGYWGVPCRQVYCKTVRNLLNYIKSWSLINSLSLLPPE